MLRGWAGGAGAVRIDLTPLRTSRDSWLLLGAGTVFYLGGMMSYVALPYQLYTLTGSNTAVGLVALVELAPLVVGGLYGGALAGHSTCSRSSWPPHPASSDRHGSRRVAEPDRASSGRTTVHVDGNVRRTQGDGGVEDRPRGRRSTLSGVRRTWRAHRPVGGLTAAC